MNTVGMATQRTERPNHTASLFRSRAYSMESPFTRCNVPDPPLYCGTTSRLALSPLFAEPTHRLRDLFKRLTQALKPFKTPSVLYPRPPPQTSTDSGVTGCRKTQKKKRSSSFPLNTNGSAGGKHCAGNVTRNTIFVRGHYKAKPDPANSGEPS